MAQANPLGLLSIIVGLSIYVASVRLVLIGRLIGSPPPDADRKKAYKLVLKTLVPADAALLLAGIFLFLHTFSTDLFGRAAPAWFVPAAVWSFFVAVILLTAHHVVAAVRSIAA